jgi:hypothetical protein
MWCWLRDARDRSQKATRIACEEVNYGLIEYDFTESSATDIDKDGNKRHK